MFALAKVVYKTPCPRFIKDEIILHPRNTNNNNNCLSKMVLFQYIKVNAPISINAMEEGVIIRPNKCIKYNGIKYKTIIFLICNYL